MIEKLNPAVPPARRTVVARMLVYLRGYFGKRGNVTRWVVGAAIVAVILANISLGDLARTLMSLVWIFIAVNLAIKIALRILSALKWHVIRLVHDPWARFRQSLAAHFAGAAVGVVLPVAGPDLTVAYAHVRQSQKVDAAISSILADRLIGVYILLAISSIAVLSDTGRLGELPALATIVGCAVAGAVVGPVVLLVIIGQRHRLPVRWLPERVAKLLRAVLSNFRAYRASGGRVLAINAAISVLVQAGRVLSIYTLALAVGISGSVRDYAVVAPIMFVIMMLPIPAASIGLEQGVFIVMLGMIGVSTEAAIAMALLNRILNIVALLPGVLCIIMGWGLRASRPEGAKVAPS